MFKLHEFARKLVVQGLDHTKMGASRKLPTKRTCSGKKFKKLSKKLLTNPTKSGKLRQ